MAVLEELRAKLLISHDRVVYVGDGSSDIHVMLHVNRLGGLTIAVSENKYITQIASRTILSDDALSVLIPVLEDIAGWDASKIRRLWRCIGHAALTNLLGCSGGGAGRTTINQRSRT